MKSPHFRRQAGDDDDDDGDSCMTRIALNMTKVSAGLPLYEEIAKAYEVDPDYGEIVAYLRAPSDDALGALPRFMRARIHRYKLEKDLLTYSIDQFDALGR
ncbi:unnamed protein product [Peronospora destructor]|uniref:Uncharacterized protein n=1 Tax=Peronospora destructor TaxID=86335 RepID=A0AAV0UTE3_9STRA|nr:unnamed protein product [Peronospora destructor]